MIYGIIDLLSIVAESLLSIRIYYSQVKRYRTRLQIYIERELYSKRMGKINFIQRNADGEFVVQHVLSGTELHTLFSNVFHSL